MQSLSERMTLYFDAGFTIIYIETFEEDKAERSGMGCVKYSGKIKLSHAKRTYQQVKR